MGLDLFGLAIKDFIRSQRIQGAMPMDCVVPRYKPCTEGPCFIERTKAFWVRYPAFEGRKQALNKGVIIADMRATSSDPDFELPKHVHQVRLLHRASVVGVNGQKARIGNPMANRIGQNIPVLAGT
jgi:hypothetical protein